MMHQNDLTISFHTQISYAFGHILNDIIAAVWFSYILIFYELSVGRNGYILVVFGQGVDCLATMVISFIFDYDTSNLRLFRLGKYKTWYIFGFIFALLSAPHCFMELPFMIDNHTLMIIIYGIAVFCSQVSWTFCQITHLALINEISITQADRICLTSWRQSGSIYAAVAVFARFWYTLAESDSRHLSKNDIKLFADNSYWLATFGGLHSLAFIFMLNEKQLLKEKNIALETGEVSLKKPSVRLSRKMDLYTKCDWLTEPVFYIATMIFMFARLYQSLLFTYMPFFLHEYLDLSKETIAIVPLIIYVTGFLCSYLSTIIENRWNNRTHLLIGIVVGMISHFWMSFGSPDFSAFRSYHIYLIAFLLGIATTTIKISSMSIVGEMIGHNRQCTSFVYAMVSFSDKLISGAAIGILEQFQKEPSSSVSKDEANQFFYTINTLVDGSVILLVLFGLIFLYFFKHRLVQETEISK